LVWGINTDGPRGGVFEKKKKGEGAQRIGDGAEKNLKKNHTHPNTQKHMGNKKKMGGRRG